MRLPTPQFWYLKRTTWCSLLLRPFSILFAWIIFCRRFCYAIGLLTVKKVSVPVIIVGNITVGGTGKTPLVMALARYLKSNQFKPGIICRNFGVNPLTRDCLLNPDVHTPAEVGDEAMLLAQTGCPVMVGYDRYEMAAALAPTCDVIISDDGLQHYRLGRDLEIAVVDGIREQGNGLLIPAGPLRETPARLKKVDIIVVNGMNNLEKYFQMTLKPIAFVQLATNERHTLSLFSGQEIHAVAGIGHPENFFKLLAELGLIVQRHVFPDHYFYQTADLAFADDLPIIMTEKDAIKCRHLIKSNMYFLEVVADFSDNFFPTVMQKLAAKLPR